MAKPKLQRILKRRTAEEIKRDAYIEARAKVFQELQSNPRYQKAFALKDRLGKAWNRADAFKEKTADNLSKRFSAVNRKIGLIEDRELAKLDRALGKL